MNTAPCLIFSNFVLSYLYEALMILSYLDEALMPYLQDKRQTTSNLKSILHLQKLFLTSLITATSSSSHHHHHYHKSEFQKAKFKWHRLPPSCLPTSEIICRNKLAKARKTRKSPGTLGLNKFGPGKLWFEKVWSQNIFINFLAELD